MNIAKKTRMSEFSKFRERRPLPFQYTAILSPSIILLCS